MPPKRSRQSAPLPLYVPPELTGKKKPRISGPATTTTKTVKSPISRKRKAQDSDAEFELEEVSRKRGGSGGGRRRAKEIGKAGKKYDLKRGEQRKSKANVDTGITDESEEEEKETAELSVEEEEEDVEVEDSQTRRLGMSGRVNVVVDGLVAKANPPVKPAAKGKEGKDHSAKQLNKLDAIYQWGEEGMDEVDGNVMGPSMKADAVDKIVTKLEANVGNWKADHQKLLQAVQTRSASVGAVVPVFTHYFRNERAPFYAALENAIHIYERRKDRIQKHLAAFQEVQRNKVLEGEAKVQTALEAKSLIRAARKFVNYHSMA